MFTYFSMAFKNIFYVPTPIPISNRNNNKIVFKCIQYYVVCKYEISIVFDLRRFCGY